jgi:hypothetical protein
MAPTSAKAEGADLGADIPVGRMILIVVHGFRGQWGICRIIPTISTKQQKLIERISKSVSGATQIVQYIVFDVHVVELQRRQVGINTTQRHQRGMGAGFDDAAVFHDDDAVGALHGRQAVRDDDGGAADHRRLQRALHQALGLGVERAGRFVEQQQRRIFQQGARDRDALALAAGQAHAALAQEGAVALRQALDEFVGGGQFRRGDDFLVAGAGTAVADVFHRVGREDDGILRHDADRAAQRVQVEVADVDAVEGDAPDCGS